MKVLVTGAAGFIGFHTTKALLDRGDQVVGLDNLNDYYDVELKKGRLARLEGRARVALAVECGLQNSALGITLALTLLDQPALAVPAVVYALLMNFTALGLIAVRTLPATRATA